MEPIKSLAELFPDAHLADDGVSQALADEANAWVSKKHPEAGELFLGPQPGLRMIEIDGVVFSDALDEIAKSSDIQMVASADRKTLESFLFSPAKDRGILAAIIQFDAFTQPQDQIKKALGQDIDLLLIGFFDEAPQPGVPLYQMLFTAAETGHAVVGILSPGRPPIRLHHADFLKSFDKKID